MEVKRYTENTNRDGYKIAQSEKYIGDDYWEWSVWMEAGSKNLDKIECVTYTLHYTFREPVQIRRNREDKFRLESSGWGTFTIYARITFKDKTVLDLEHELDLTYPEEENNAASKSEGPGKTDEPEKNDHPEKKPKKR